MHGHSLAPASCGRTRAALPLPHTPMLLLLLVVALVLPLSVVTPATAASSFSTAAGSHMGDVIPLTMYVRLRRQVKNSFFGRGNGVQLDVADEAEVTDMDGNVVIAEGGTTAMPEEWAATIHELQLPSIGGTTGKHAAQIVRNLPPSFCPRFGINKDVMLKANDTLHEAGAQMESTPGLLQSDLALRFSMGRGVQKETVWLPLATQAAATHQLVSLFRRMAEEQDMLRRTLGKGNDDPRTTQENAEGAPHFLRRVTFLFHYQSGELQKPTHFFVLPTYGSLIPEGGIEVRYMWEEGRPYNPNRALMLSSAVSLLVAMIMTVVVLHPSSRSMLLFSQRIVAVREHE